MMVKNILFDLDGTLTESAPGITNSLKHAQERLGMPVSETEELLKFVGPPLLPMFQSEWGLDEETAKQALVYYREYFTVQGLFENAVYPGVYDMLERLKNAGAKLYVATSKPEPLTERILEHFDLRKYFDGVAGSLMNETRTTKAEVIAYALEHFGLDASETVMVGDRRHDVEGAAENGIPTVGVLYGYGDEAELMDACAVRLCDTAEEVAEYLINPPEDKRDIMGSRWQDKVMLVLFIMGGGLFLLGLAVAEERKSMMLSGGGFLLLGLVMFVYRCVRDAKKREE